MFEIFKKNKDQYSSQKIVNRKKLDRQNLIFLLGAIIIIIVLVVAIVSNLSFLAEKINEGVGLAIDSGIKKPDFFNLEGFNRVKDKVLSPALVAPEEQNR